MGIEYEAAIMVGLPQCEMADALVDKLVNEECEFELCTPYYDGGGSDDAIVGYTYDVSDTYAATELEWDESKIVKLKAKFKKNTGLDAKVWLSPLGY